MADSDLTPFKGFRTRTILVGAATSVVSFALLLLVLRSGDSTLTCGPASQEGSICTFANGWTSAWQAAATGGLTTLLGIGLVSLLFEFLLRKQFGADMLRFLKLDGAVVRSGLATLGSTRGVEFHKEFQAVDVVSIVARSPAGWVNEYLPALLREGAKRRIEVTLALPDPDNAGVIHGCATSLGQDPQELINAIRSFKQSAESQWRTSLPGLSVGTSLRVVWLDEVATYDVIVGNSLTVVLMSKPIGHSDSDEFAVIVFRDQQTDFPSHWIKSSLNSLDTANEAFAGEKK